MELVNNYIPGDQLLVDKIVYELKSQGIFDQFRKECFADVDTKPAYQNLRQRVENNVSRFLRDQRWKPDMNKNQVREMLRKSITESGFLDIGVERIVDQVVNPKISSVFLPKVEEIVFSFLGIRKPKEEENEEKKDLLPTDLEAASPESKGGGEKSCDAEQLELDDSSKMEEDESPPFEPLDEQTYGTQEDNSVDSHLSGFSGLVSHESNQSTETPKPQNNVELSQQDSQSRHSSDSRLSIVTSDDNFKMDVCDDSQSKLIKTSKNESEKNKYKSDKHKTRNKDDKDRKSSKDSKLHHSSSSSKDRDRNRDRKDSKGSSKYDKSKDKRSSSSSKHSSRDKDRDKEKTVKKESSKHDSNRSKDSKSKDTKHKSSDKHRKDDKHSHSNDKHKKDRRKENRSKDDHYSLKNKRNNRRSTDRDSNDGGHSSHKLNVTENGTTQQRSNQTNGSQSTESRNSEQTENMTKKDSDKVKLNKPKFASNMQEAMRLMKIRKQLAKLERKNQLSLASVNVDNNTLASSSINLNDIKINGLSVIEDKLNSVTSQDNWDKMEEKLQKEIIDCRYFESIDLTKIEFLQVIEKYLNKLNEDISLTEKDCFKRKITDIDDEKNNNKNVSVKRVCLRNSLVKRNKEKNSIIEVSSDFPLPLSPAESDNSNEKKEETVIPVKSKRNINIANQRYSSDDLYKPRASFSSSRRRFAKNLDN